MTAEKNRFDELLTSLIKKTGISLTDEHIISIISFLKFGIVGFTNTFISYLINVSVLYFLSKYQLSWDYFAANIIAFIISVLWSFYWNNKYVFGNGTSNNIFSKLLKTYISYGFTGIVLSNLFSFFWVEVLHISKYIAPLINLVVSVPLNYLIHKYWVYKT